MLYFLQLYVSSNNIFVLSIFLDVITHLSHVRKFHREFEDHESDLLLWWMNFKIEWLSISSNSIKSSKIKFNRIIYIFSLTYWNIFFLKLIMFLKKKCFDLQEDLCEIKYIYLMNVNSVEDVFIIQKSKTNEIFMKLFVSNSMNMQIGFSFECNFYLRKLYDI